jgi:AraC family transcriptional activator of mar-sox-rob regulon
MLWSVQVAIVQSTEWHMHEVFELIFCNAGTGKVIVGETALDFGVNRMILIFPRARHRYVLEGGEAVKLKIVCLTAQDVLTYLSPVQVAALESLRSQGCTFSDSENNSAQLLELIQMIPDQFVVEDQRKLLTIWGVVGLLLGTHTDEQGPKPDENKRRYETRIQDVCRWLNHHLEQDCNLDRIAAKFDLSRSLLTRTFRANTGTSVVEYVNARRLEKAAVLLTSQSQTILEVAFDSGFSNLSHFHRKFKAAYGLTPAAFRQNFAQ